MNKIPVKIVKYTINNETRKNILIDLMDTYDIDGDVEEKINQFKKQYFELVKKAKKILPSERNDRKSSHFWKLGKILNDFNKSIEHLFEITNFQHAIVRDFGLYRKRQIALIFQFGKQFKKKDISDSIPFSHYAKLIFHANMLIKLKLFEQEKKRLLIMAKEKSLPNSCTYDKQLDELTRSLQTRKIRVN